MTVPNLHALAGGTYFPPHLPESGLTSCTASSSAPNVHSETKWVEIDWLSILHELMSYHRNEISSFEKTLFTDFYDTLDAQSSFSNQILDRISKYTHAMPNEDNVTVALAYTICEWLTLYNNGYSDKKESRDDDDPIVPPEEIKKIWKSIQDKYSPASLKKFISFFH